MFFWMGKLDIRNDRSNKSVKYRLMKCFPVHFSLDFIPEHGDLDAYHLISFLAINLVTSFTAFRCYVYLEKSIELSGL